MASICSKRLKQWEDTVKELLSLFTAILQHDISGPVLCTQDRLDSLLSAGLINISNTKSGFVV